MVSNFYAFLFNGIFYFTQTGSVGKHNRITFQIQVNINRIAGGSGNIGNDGRFTINNSIQQT